MRKYILTLADLYATMAVLVLVCVLPTIFLYPSLLDLSIGAAGLLYITVVLVLGAVLAVGLLIVIGLMVLADVLFTITK